MPLVVVKNLHKSYRSNKSSAVVSSTSFAVEEGEIFGLLGPNGAGKSTMLNIIIAETKATSGSVSIEIKSICRSCTYFSALNKIQRE